MIFSIRFKYLPLGGYEDEARECQKMGGFILLFFLADNISANKPSITKRLWVFVED
jgi:hypothetical protein